MRFAVIIFTAPLASRLYEQRVGTRNRTRQGRFGFGELDWEKHILIRIWSNLLALTLPDTSLCEAQGDGGGRPFPAGCRENGKSREKIAEKLI